MNDNRGVKRTNTDCGERHKMIYSEQQTVEAFVKARHQISRREHPLLEGMNKWSALIGVFRDSVICVADTENVYRPTYSLHKNR